MRSRVLLLSLSVCVVACSHEEGEPLSPPIFTKTSHPQVGVSVTSDMFVTAKLPLLTDVGGAYLVRLQLSPADRGETRAIADVCRAGGSAVVTVKGASIPPFIVTSVTNDADALVLCPTREAAVAILRALKFEEKDFGGWKP
jgi:hypothetical protein